jgi:hypothetical protein
MIDQNIAAIQREQMAAQGLADNYQNQKVQDELNMKTNLDYENRLRGHMYQFDDSDGMQVQGVKPEKGKKGKNKVV